MTARFHLAQFGELGEQYVAGILRQLGHSVSIVGRRATYDLLIDDILKAEVKSATPTLRYSRPSRRWQFSLRRNGLPVTEDILFLVCYNDELEPIGTYVIPSSAIDAQLTKIDITSTLDAYAGKWAAWLNGWGEVARLLATASSKQTSADCVDLPSLDDIPF